MRCRLRLVVSLAGLALTAAVTHARQGENVGERAPARSEAVRLKVGDKAPPLRIATWIKGAPLAEFATGRVYVIEFWATWCGPCIQSMPHLSDLQERFKGKGVTIVGVSTRDNNGNTLERATDMIAKKGDSIAYSIAWDQEEETHDAYMKAAGQTGIPTCFVIDRTGSIAYIGDPVWLDVPIERLLSGTWSAEKGMQEIGDAERRFAEIMSASDLSMEEKVDRIGEVAEKFSGVRPAVEMARYALALKGGRAESSPMGRRIADRAIAHKDAETLNEVAWRIVSPKSKAELRDLDLALFAATKADELTDHADPTVLVTLAWAHFWKGSPDTAIEIARRATELAPDRKAEIQGSIDRFLQSKK